MEKHSLLDQIKQHSIAIISLIIAIIALSYNTWRDEETEKNRNIRQAAFEVLKHLGELQVVINYGHFEPDNTMGNPVLGWGHLAIINDLSQLMPPPIPEKAEKLSQAWDANWQQIKTSSESTDKISNEIDQSRDAILNEIRHLK